jgi:hypothetical protein
MKEYTKGIYMRENVLDNPNTQKMRLLGEQVNGVNRSKLLVFTNG